MKGLPNSSNTSDITTRAEKNEIFSYSSYILLITDNDNNDKEAIPLNFILLIL